MKKMLLIAASIVVQSGLFAADIGQVSESLVIPTVSPAELAQFQCSAIQSATLGGTTAVVSGNHPDYLKFKNCMEQKGFVAPKSAEIRYNAPVRFGASHGLGGGSY